MLWGWVLRDWRVHEVVRVIVGGSSEDQKYLGAQVMPLLSSSAAQRWKREAGTELPCFINIWGRRKPDMPI